MESDSKRGKKLSTIDVVDSIMSFEECEESYTDEYPFSLLHYAFAFRRFDAVYRILKNLSESEMTSALHLSGCAGYEWVTPLIVAKWNLSYLLAYDEKNGTNIFSILEKYLDEVEHIEEVMEYADKIGSNGEHDVFDVFWNGNQPVLDIICYPRQLLASRQVENNGFSLVFDEVGTGKTVSALYAVRDVLCKCINSGNKAKILVVCPYNKREDWQSDIRRQLGRFAHIIEQGDNGKMYEEDLKKVFFKNTEHVIMVAGQRQGSDKNGSNSALKGSIERYSKTKSWDLVIIDEAHISFDNYTGIRADKVMLLTATPIVVNSKGKRLYEDYLRLVEKIIGKKVITDIKPIDTPEPTADDAYVNWFREDVGQKSVERKIRFVTCKRWDERDKVFYQIKADKGALAAFQYDQDDDYLYQTAKKYGYGDIHAVRENGKLERLTELLREGNKSYIIFCEHTDVVDNIFLRIKDIFADCIVAKKYGKTEDQYGLENVQAGQLINTLMQALRIGKRVFFVTTGKTGGTGLNLGEFDGVIHYELPFTSIELEQRFGRVDRLDTHKAAKSRDMIFLLNECRENESDLETNRMLYYCTTKIDVTCQFMPIRNTVLYYPEFIRRNGEAIRKAMDYYKGQNLLSEKNEMCMRKIRKNIQQYEKKIKDAPSWDKIKDFGKDLDSCVDEALSREKDKSISDEYYELLNTYLKYYNKTKKERDDYQKVYRSFLEARKSVKNWLAIIGLIKVEGDSDIFVGAEAYDDGGEQKIVSGNGDSDEQDKADTDEKPHTIQRQINEIIQLIDGCVSVDKELGSFSSEGIFCYKNGRICRLEVKQYRGGNAWDRALER